MQIIRGALMIYGRRILALVMIAFTLSATRAAQKLPLTPVRVALVGDSTVCNYRPQSPIHGWGEYLGNFLNPKASISNFAAAGASTRSFIASGQWQKTLASRPQYILIQFGHNDSEVDNQAVAADPQVEYPAFLRRFVAEARAIGAKPIFVTSMEYRLFDGAGNVHEKLAPYASAMKEVARAEKIPIIDLHTASCQLYQKLGPVGVRQLGSVPDDRTHFNEQGAKAMAQLVATELIVQIPSLKPISNTPPRRKGSQHSLRAS